MTAAEPVAGLPIVHKAGEPTPNSLSPEPEESPQFVDVAFDSSDENPLGLEMDWERLLVVRVIGGTPAERQSCRANDELVLVNGERAVPSEWIPLLKAFQLRPLRIRLARRQCRERSRSCSRTPRRPKSGRRKTAPPSPERLAAALARVPPLALPPAPPPPDSEIATARLRILPLPAMPRTLPVQTERAIDVEAARLIDEELEDIEGREAEVDRLIEEELRDM